MAPSAKPAASCTSRSPPSANRLPIWSARSAAPLLNRTSGRTRLTPHGQLFLAEARKTLLAADRAVEITNRSLRGQVGSLSIGFFLWGAGGFFARIIRDYRKLHPDIKLSLYEMRTPEQMEALTAGKIDVAFARPLEPPFDRTLRAELSIATPSSSCCLAIILWQEAHLDRCPGRRAVRPVRSPADDHAL